MAPKQIDRLVFAALARAKATGSETLPAINLLKLNVSIKPSLAIITFHSINFTTHKVCILIQVSSQVTDKSNIVIIVKDVLTESIEVRIIANWNIHAIDVSSCLRKFYCCHYSCPTSLSVVLSLTQECV